MKDDLFLVEPSLDYKDTLYELINEYKANEEKVYYEMYKEALQDYACYVKKLNDNAKGVNLPKDCVPSHTFWLSNKNDKILEFVNI